MTQRQIGIVEIITSGKKRPSGEQNCFQNFWSPQKKILCTSSALYIVDSGWPNYAHVTLLGDSRDHSINTKDCINTKYRANATFKAENSNDGKGALCETDKQHNTGLDWLPVMRGVPPSMHSFAQHQASRSWWHESHRSATTTLALYRKLFAWTKIHIKFFVL